MADPAARGVGLVLLSGGAARAAEWVRRGVVPCHVGEHPAWTMVTPASAVTAAAAPYDDALTLLASRHVGPRQSPTIGLFVIDDAAVITAQAAGWRTVRRWALRGVEREVRPGPELPALRPQDLHRVLASAAPQRRIRLAEITDLWRRTDLTQREWLVEAAQVLGLPGARVLSGQDPAPGPRIDPDPRAVGAFETVVKDVQP
ncbi:hypothetical protein GCM10027055_23350 [Janibacter alkaliphilus]|uniref:Uncharacterized protein n=1 Tax=Janibacter alkaliphilus TaxID=1069963 RepID=A0A852X637_9MICO|nr:hypothetical protein [Janibacter alkaliphilus]NYG38359.1 hypothetical protein [Janibacter alkaliphilus]